MVESIKVMTAGRLIIEPYPGGTLVANADLFDAVSKGVLELAYSWPGYYSGLEPSMVCFSGLPYGLRKMEEQRYLITEAGWLDILKEVCAKHNVHAAALGPVASYGELSSTKPIRSVDDFEGLNIRGYGMYNRIFEAFGARGVSIAAGEIYTALATGTIDAAIWSSAKGHYDFKLHEVAEYWITPPMSRFIMSMCFANGDAWAALPDDIKAVVEMVLYHTLQQKQTLDSYDSAVALKDMVDSYGVEVITMPDADIAQMQAATTELWAEQAAADESSARLIKIIEDFMRVQGYIE